MHSVLTLDNIAAYKRLESFVDVSLAVDNIDYIDYSNFARNTAQEFEYVQSSHHEE